MSELTSNNKGEFERLYFTINQRFTKIEITNQTLQSKIVSTVSQTDQLIKGIKANIEQINHINNYPIIMH